MFRSNPLGIPARLQGNGGMRTSGSGTQPSPLHHASWSAAATAARLRASSTAASVLMLEAASQGRSSTDEHRQTRQVSGRSGGQQLGAARGSPQLAATGRLQSAAQMLASVGEGAAAVGNCTQLPQRHGSVSSPSRPRSRSPAFMQRLVTTMHRKIGRSLAPGPGEPTASTRANPFSGPLRRDAGALSDVQSRRMGEA